MIMTMMTLMMMTTTLLCTSLVRGLENSQPVQSDLILDEFHGDGDGVGLVMV